MTPDADIAALGRGNTVAVGLPGTPFGLAHRDFTPAGAILAAGGCAGFGNRPEPRHHVVRIDADGDRPWFAAIWG